MGCILAVSLFLLLSISLISAETVKITVSAIEDGEESTGEDLMIEVGDYISINGKIVQIQKQIGDDGKKTKIKSDGISAETELEVIQEEDDSGKLKVNLSNGKNVEIKIMPDKASEKAIAALKLHVCSEENDCEIELKEVGSGDEAKAVYEIKAQKQVKLLWLFNKKMQVSTEIDADNGDVISTKKPWWGFLTKDSEESAA